MNLKHQHGEEVPPHSLGEALDHVAAGGSVWFATYTRLTILDTRVFNRFEKAGSWLLKEDGNGYRMKTGKTSVYLPPGLLKFGAPKPRGRR